MTSMIRSVAIVTLTLAAPLLAEDQPLHSGLPVGSDLPGPIHAMSISGEFAARYHDPITDNALNPGVIVFVWEIPSPDQPLAKFIQGMDGLVKQFPDIRWGLDVIVLDDGGYQQALVTTIDDGKYVTDLPLTKALKEKDDRVLQLQNLSKKLGLRLVEFSLGRDDGAAGYHINPDAGMTMLLYYKFKVLGNWSLSKKDMTDESVQRILNELKARLAKIEKPMQGRR
jgi:hypothetical protein